MSDRADRVAAGRLEVSSEDQAQQVDKLLGRVHEELAPKDALAYLHGVLLGADVGRLLQPDAVGTLVEKHVQRAAQQVGTEMLRVWRGWILRWILILVFGVNSAYLTATQVRTMGTQAAVGFGVLSSSIALVLILGMCHVLGLSRAWPSSAEDRA